VALFEAWGEIDRSHCKLAHRGSRLQLVHVSHQGWIETLFGHVKGEWPHLEKISDPGELERELDLRRVEYNSVRLHAGVGYVTPDDEHEGRGEGIRQARRDGLAAAREARINYRRTTTKDQR
jgi:putative transposase